MFPYMLHALLKPHCYTAHRGFRQLTELLISEEFGANKYLTQEDLDFGLHFAAHEGHLDIVQLFLEAGANTNSHCDEWNSAFDAAMEGRQYGILEFLVSHGADVNSSPGLLSRVPHSEIRMIKIFLDGGANVDMQTGYRGTALCRAAANIDSVHFDLLLEMGADVNAPSKDYGTPLQATCSSWSGESELVLGRIQKLLDCGADPNIQSGQYGTALQAACHFFLRSSFDFKVAMKVISLLIEHSANANAQGGEYYGSALHAAAASSLPQATQAMKLLLDNGAEIDQQGNDSWKTALQVACYEGTIEAVRFLLDYGADVNAEGGRYSTPLQAAAARRLDEESSDEELKTKLLILEMVINEGANITQQIGAALQLAAWDSPNEEVLRFLLARGADVNAQDRGSTTALIAACRNLENDTKCVRLLLDYGADVNIQSEYYGSALISTCLPKHHRLGYDAMYDGQIAVRVAQLLLDRGADVNAQHGKYGTALRAACSWNNTLVRLLLEHGADVQLQDYAAWYTAVRCGGIYRLRLLLDQGIDANHVSEEHGTALHAVMGVGAWECHTENIDRDWSVVVSFFLQHGIDPNVTSEKLGSALQIACGATHSDFHPPVLWEILQSGINEIPVAVLTLLERCPDINVNAHGGFFGSALQAAAYSGQTLLVRLLLDKGANINARGGNYRSALNGAVVRGCWDIVEILLKAGATPDCLLQQQPDEEWLQSVLEEDGRGAVERYRKFWEVEMENKVEGKGGLNL